MPPPVRGIALPVLAALCLAAAPVAAQAVLPPVPTRPAARPALPDGDALTLGGPVDPEAYLVGPGDVFVVSIGGSLTAGGLGQTTTTVTADGLLVIPQAGTFEAAGRPLADVRAEARAALRRQYLNVPTDVALAAPRQFVVYVSGAVPAPGRQAVSAVGRVEDAVAAAAGDVPPLALADYVTPPRAEGVDRRPALRNVTVTGRDGATARVDLLRFYATGDLAFNPALRDGAAVVVPTFDPAREGVAVSGDVDRPGVYDGRPDDTAAALVAVAGGPSLGTGGATVRRTRLVGGRREVAEVPLAEAAALDVRARDQLSVRSAAPEAGFAQALGAVAYPGTYPVVTGRTRLAELVDAAGGLAPDALVRGAYLERRVLPTEPPPPAGADSTVITLGRLSDLGLVGRSYYAAVGAGPARVAVDVAAALDGGADVVLRDGDRLVVPRDLGAIRVAGQVADPGLVPFEPGRTAGDYVARAGGLGPAATTVYTVDARTGLFQAGPETPVLPGDAVFVDRPLTSDTPAIEGLALQREGVRLQAETVRLQEERAERDAARDRRQFLIQAVSTGLFTLSTVISTYFLIRNNTR